MSDTVIEVNRLSKIYKLYDKPIDRIKEVFSISRKVRHKEYYALSNLTFKVNRGEAIGIIGMNGSGKSTLLKIITGVLSPSGGFVKVNGRISALLELGAGFNPEYTGIENIYLNGTMMGYTKEEVDDKIYDILEFADIGDFVYQPVKTYSSGMFVRLAFAVAINIDPDILIVDEALAVGDSKFQSKCFDKFNEFRNLGKTILLVTHDIESVKRFCDRVVWLENGKEKAIGNSKDITSRYLANIYSLDVSKIEEVIESERYDTIKKNTEFKFISRWGENVGLIKYASLNNIDRIDSIVIDYKECLKFESIIDFGMEVKNRENLFFSLSIKDLKGQDIIFVSTDGNCFSSIEGNIFRINFEFENVLNPGKYFITICLEYRNDYDYTNQHVYIDYIDWSVYFELKNDVKKHYGLLSINSEYKVEPIE